jgi:hypothetical protein
LPPGLKTLKIPEAPVKDLNKSIEEEEREEPSTRRTLEPTHTTRKESPRRQQSPRKVPRVPKEEKALYYEYYPIKVRDHDEVQIPACAAFMPHFGDTQPADINPIYVPPNPADLNVPGIASCKTLSLICRTIVCIIPATAVLSGSRKLRKLQKALERAERAQRREFLPPYVTEAIAFTPRF